MADSQDFDEEAQLVLSTLQQSIFNAAIVLCDEGVPGLPLDDDDDDDLPTLVLCTSPSDIDLVVFALAFERTYIHQGGNVPPPPSYYKTHIRVHWRPQPEDLQCCHGVPEPERPYNKLWIQHFRITYEGFQYIKKAIAPLLRRHGSPIGGRTPLSPGEQLCCALWWLAQGGEYRATATAAHRSRASIHRCVVRVCDAICKRLGSKHVVFPQTPQQLEAAVGVGW